MACDQEVRWLGNGTWFWRTVVPAYEALDESALVGAREQAQRMRPDPALLYAAGDDD